MLSESLVNLSALKAGDNAAWDAAFFQFWPIALRAPQNPVAGLLPSEAEDVASEAIAEIIFKVETIATLEDLERLLKTIALRRAISLARSKSAIKRRLPDNYDPMAVVEASQPPTGPSELERDELTVLLDAALEG